MLYVDTPTRPEGARATHSQVKTLISACTRTIVRFLFSDTTALGENELSAFREQAIFFYFFLSYKKKEEVYDVAFPASQLVALNR